VRSFLLAVQFRKVCAVYMNLALILLLFLPVSHSFSFSPQSHSSQASTNPLPQIEAGTKEDNSNTNYFIKQISTLALNNLFQSGKKKLPETKQFLVKDFKDLMAIEMFLTLQSENLDSLW